MTTCSCSLYSPRWRYERRSIIMPEIILLHHEQRTRIKLTVLTYSVRWFAIANGEAREGERQTIALWSLSRCTPSISAQEKLPFALSNKKKARSLTILFVSVKCSIVCRSSFLSAPIHREYMSTSFHLSSLSLLWSGQHVCISSSLYLCDKWTGSLSLCLLFNARERKSY